MYDTIFSKMDLNLWTLCHKYYGTSEDPHLDLNSHLDLELLFYLITHPIQPTALHPH
jgi:hypothetical protein